MANVTAALAVPSANGVGAPSDVSVLGPDKTIVVTGNIEAVLAVQVSEDGVSYCTVMTFTAPGSTVLPGTVAAWMRIVVSGYKRGSAVCNVGAELAVNDFVALPVPAGNGAGAAVDVSAFGSLWTILVGELGPFLGALAIEVSQDGVSWGQAFGTFTSGGCDSAVVSAAWARVRRSSFNVYQPGPMSVALGALRAVSGGTATDFIQAGAGAVLRTSQDKERETVSVLDYLNGSDVRSAIVDAIAYLATVNGGTLHFPKRVTPYDIDNTGLGPLLLSVDGIRCEGDSMTGTVIRNVSTDGTDLFQTTTGLKRWAWRKMKIDSLATAGHIWSGDFGISFSLWEDLWVRQLATTKSIMVHALNTEGSGMYEDEFLRGMYEIGTESTPATVPAFDLSAATISLLNLCSWRGPIRFHLHSSYAPFFKIVNDAGGGSFLRNINWTGPINVEKSRRGVWYLAGLQQCTIEDVGSYDTEVHDGHGVELAAGAGGQECDHVIIKRVTRYGMLPGSTVGAAAEPFVTVATLTQSGGTATCTTSAAHGFATGDSVDFVGASPAAYNGAKPITVLNATQFTFPIDGGTASPATGTIKAARIGRAVTSITHVAGVATVTTLQAHGFAVDQRVNNLGADQAGYNGRFTVLSVPTPTTFTIAVDPGTVTPATGTITTQAAALDIKIGTTCTNTTLEDIGSASAINEIDAGGTAVHAQASSKSDFYRLGANSVYSEIGSAGLVQAPAGKFDDLAASTAGGSISATSLIDATLGVSFNSNADLTDLLATSAVLDFGSIAAGGSAELTVTVSGISINWRCKVAPQSTIESGLVWNEWISAADTVRIRVSNITAGAIDPASRTWLVTCWKH